MRWFFVVGLVTACGNGDSSRHITDAPLEIHDAGLDAPSGGKLDASCTSYLAATSTATDTVSFTFSGGAFESYGCAPIDPNYWMSGAGMSAAVTFVVPQSQPSIRVWGMNDDDTASVLVNGTAYALGATTASLSPKVVCGLSPGQDGMTFVNGMLTGANSNGAGNYSYQDVAIDQTNVTSIQISGLTGLGWGFAGASVPGCAAN